jgi:hypothetical protein
MQKVVFILQENASLSMEHQSETGTFRKRFEIIPIQASTSRCFDFWNIRITILCPTLLAGFWIGYLRSARIKSRRIDSIHWRRQEL